MPSGLSWPQIFPAYLEPSEPVLWQRGRHQLLPFRQKVLLLERAGIALWDVLASCQRQSSADHSIRQPIANAIGPLLEECCIENILLNGQKSADLLRKHIALSGDYKIWTLPSTSPANASMSLETKLLSWQLALSAIDS